jgi:hypothetical protein
MKLSVIQIGTEENDIYRGSKIRVWIYFLTLHYL